MESIIDASSARKNPLKIFALSFVFVTLAVFATLFLHTQEASFLFVLFVVVPSVPFVLNLFCFEESEFSKRPHRVAGSRTLARHLPTIIVLLAYFVGITAGFTFWFLVLPDSDVGSLYSLQTSELQSVRAQFQGRLVDAPTEFNVGAFDLLFMHNLQVLLIVMVLSLLYGAGAVFVLVWNASVIAVFIGSVIDLAVLHDPMGGLVSGLGYGVFGILPHGIFELLAYLTTALSGGIISQAVVNKSYKHPLFVQLVYDSAKLFAWAIVFLAIGALIESTGMPVN